MQGRANLAGAWTRFSASFFPFLLFLWRTRIPLTSSGSPVEYAAPASRYLLLNFNISQVILFLLGRLVLVDYHEYDLPLCRNTEGRRQRDDGGFLNVEGLLGECRAKVGEGTMPYRLISVCSN